MALTYENLLGKTFGRITVLSEIPRPISKGKPPSRRWRCRCSCGTEFIVVGQSLRSGCTKSCGCLRRELGVSLGKSSAKHGMWKSKEYGIWHGMKNRCTNPRDPGWPYYGGRGIAVCDRWKDSFADFFADMGQRPSSLHSLERENVDGPYSPENCCWANATEQMRNRRDNVMLSYQGKTLSVYDWADMVGIHFKTILTRLARGWAIDRALKEPVERHIKL